MKFKFSLQKVMEHRKVVEGLAQKDFQEALSALQRETSQLQKMEDDVHQAHLRRGELSSQGGQQGPALAQIHEFLRGQSVLIEKQKLRVQEAKKLVESRREILRQAAVDYKIIEKMRENKFEEYKERRQSEEQKEMDEQSILRFKAVKES